MEGRILLVQRNFDVHLLVVFLFICMFHDQLSFIFVAEPI